MKLEDKAILISRYVQEWLDENNKVEAKPDEVMSYLQEKGIYNKNRKSAKQLRSDLRKLVDRNLLYLIKGCKYEQKTKNKFWFFYKA